MKNLRLKRVGTLIFTLCFAATAEAQQIYEFYTGVRQNAMGGAYTAVVNDETAVLVNPAGLGKIRDTTVTFFDPEVSLSANALTVFDTSSYGKMLNQQETMNQMVAAASAEPLHMKGQLFPSVILENFGVGLHLKYQTDASLDSTQTNYNLHYVNDWALALAYNFRLFGGVLKIGVGARLIDRTEIIKTVPVTTTDLEVNNYGSEGLGISAITGMILTAPVAWLPSLSAVVQDVGGTSFTLSDGLFNKVGDRRPEFVSQKVDAGISFSPILANHIRMTITGEMHDLTNLSLHLDKTKLIHAGAEINFADFFFLRGGMNQRYWTAGTEFATEQFQLQASSYGEEVGIYPATKEDRRYMGKFTLRF